MTDKFPVEEFPSKLRSLAASFRKSGNRKADTASAKFFRAQDTLRADVYDNVAEWAEKMVPHWSGADVDRGQIIENQKKALAEQARYINELVLRWSRSEALLEDIDNIFHLQLSRAVANKNRDLDEGLLTSASYWDAAERTANILLANIRDARKKQAQDDDV